MTAKNKKVIRCFSWTCLIVALIASLSLNYVFYKADIQYYLTLRKIKRIEAEKSPILHDIKCFQKELADASKRYLVEGKRIELPEYSDMSFRERFKRADDRDKLPVFGSIWGAEDGYLFLSLIDAQKDEGDFFHSYFNGHGGDFDFKLNEQALYGLVATKLYTISKLQKYKEYADSVFHWLQTKDTDYGIPYVSGMKVQFVDGLGMVVPFLTKYAEVFNCPEANALAIKQVELYSKYGVDKETGMPFFQYSIEEPHIKCGYSNWGRGTSWYVLGLASVDTTMLSEETQHNISRLNETLVAIWNREHRFTRFIGESSSEMDLSAELPILWYLNKTGAISLTEKDVLEYSQYMHDGIMYHCSNGNSGAVKVIPHGPNILAQAFMLKLVNEMYENKK